MPSTLSEKARAFLQERRFAVLATLNKDGSPQLATMWYLRDENTIIMNTKAGRVKDLNMKRDPRISICVEHGYNYVTISGNVEMDEDQETAFFFQAEDGIRDVAVTGVQTCALPI